MGGAAVDRSMTSSSSSLWVSWKGQEVKLTVIKVKSCLGVVEAYRVRGEGRCLVLKFKGGRTSHAYDTV